MDKMPNVIMNVEEPEINEEITEEIITREPMLNEEDIFIDDRREKEKVRDTPEKKEEIEEIEEIEPEPEKPVKTKKKRKPMSEEHKEKLKLAREKALETRRRNAKEKREIKELNKRKKEMELEKLRNEVHGVKVKEVKTVVEQPKPVIIKEQSFTKKDIEEAQYTAIANYEKMRKAEKQKKKELERAQREAEEVKKKLNKAVNFTSNRADARYGDEDYFSNCW